MVPIVISREMIKPSSPTPQHLRKVKLSYLDQFLSPPSYFSLIFFYQALNNNNNNNNNDHHVRKSQHLKQSLSHALTSFYPLAGRLHDNFTIDCNDAGVEFIDANIDHAPLEEDAIQGDDDDDQYYDHFSERYLPVDPTTTACGETTKLPFLLVQVTYSDDHYGGVAVGVRFLHRVADCASIMDFISTWARINKNGIVQTPARLINFNLANYFPAVGEFPIPGFVTLSSSRTKRLVFDKVKLSGLRQQLAGDHDVVERPTRVELVTAFIWKYIMHYEQQQNNKMKTFVAAAHVVNLRPRKKILENVFGNCLMMATAFVADEDDDDDEFHFHELVRGLRSAIGAVNEDYITASEGGGGGGGGNNYLNDQDKVVGLVTEGRAKRCVFSSWCGFPMYEVDFGWGKPTWLCPVGLTGDCTILVNTRCGEGIEAWVCMDPDVVSSLEAKFQSSFFLTNNVINK